MADEEIEEAASADDGEDGAGPGETAGVAGALDREAKQRAGCLLVACAVGRPELTNNLDIPQQMVSAAMDLTRRFRRSHPETMSALHALLAPAVENLLRELAGEETVDGALQSIEHELGSLPEPLPRIADYYVDTIRSVASGEEAPRVDPPLLEALVRAVDEEGEPVPEAVTAVLERFDRDNPEMMDALREYVVQGGGLEPVLRRLMGSGRIDRKGAVSELMDVLGSSYQVEPGCEGPPGPHDLLIELQVASRLDVPTPNEASITAAVFGAGIAGLTAAHELAERGFKVTVFEPTPDERGGSLPKLGGMAASHIADEYVTPNDQSQDSYVSKIRRFPGSSAINPGPPELPGEHGFRFFPAYYLHIWDMLQRIPLSFEHTSEDGSVRVNVVEDRSVFDNVQRVVTQVTTTPAGKPNLVFPREAPRSLPEFLGSLNQLSAVGFTGADLATFSSRLMTYLTTSPLRRAQELEDLSMYDYLIGYDADTGAQAFHYSDAFDEQIAEMPKVLAAFDAQWGDARTNLSTYLQLQLRMDRRDNKADGVLNGPTTETWFDHWGRHLTERLGVTFVQAYLHEFQLDGQGRISATVTFEENGSPKPARPGVTKDDDGSGAFDYIVCATDANRAELASAPIRNSVGGAVKQLEGFTTKKPTPGAHDPSAPPGTLVKREWTAMGDTGVEPWDRWQTLAGLQFFFDTQFQVAQGHVYFTGTEWGLSSINQHGLWGGRHHPNLATEDYVAIMSVDIGNWNAPSPYVTRERDGRTVQLTAAECTADELAKEVWRQIVTALTAGQESPTAVLPKPAFYMIDRNIKIDGNGSFVVNRTPYLVPIVGDWDNRPGGYPWNPHHSSLSYVLTQQDRHKARLQNVWMADHGGYLIHGNTLVFAGTWTKTFTRMTSMEAACESGRHAVNAILDHLIYSQSGDGRGNDVGLRWMFPFGFLDQDGLGPVRQPTPVGDYCYIFDIENREPAEVRPMRIADSKSAEDGGPHPWNSGMANDLTRYHAGLVGALLDPLLENNPYSSGYVDRMVAHVREVREFFEGLYGADEADADNDADGAQRRAFRRGGIIGEDRGLIRPAPGGGDLGQINFMPVNPRYTLEEDVLGTTFVNVDAGPLPIAGTRFDGRRLRVPPIPRRGERRFRRPEF